MLLNKILVIKNSKNSKRKGFDNSKPIPEIKYTVLQIISKSKRGDEETVGYLFIRLFQGIFIKRKYVKRHGFRKDDDSHLHKDIKKRIVYCIFLMGKRYMIEGIDKLLSANATKVQSEAFGIDTGSIKDYTQR